MKRCRTDILAAMPATREQLGERTGYSMPTIYRWITLLHAEKAIHVSDWHVTHRGTPAEIFTAAPGNDVPCKWKPTTAEQRYSKWVRKMKGSGEMDFLKAKKRARYHADKPKPPANWASTLGAI